MWNHRVQLSFNFTHHYRCFSGLATKQKQNQKNRKSDGRYRHCRMLAATIPTIFKCPLFQPHSAGVQYHSAASPCDLKPFESIPGPRPLPFIGNIFRYITGEYSLEQLYASGLKKYKQFGPIVREEIVPGVHLLLLFDPEDIERMYQLEGKYPSRRSHTALEYYRLQKPEVYSSGGLIPTNGPEWHRMRMSLQRPINMTENIRRYVKEVDEVAGEFAEKVANSARLEQHSTNFLDDLSRVFLEFIGLVVFDTRLGSLGKDVANDARSSKLIEAAYDTNSQILGTDNGLQLWKKLGLITPAYKKLRDSQEYIEKVALEYVHAKMDEILKREKPLDDGKKTLLEIYLSSSELNVKDVVTMVSDMILAGIDTSSYTMSFILYHLAKNPSKQDELFAELVHLLPDHNTSITGDLLGSSQLKYLKAVVKESFRLNPISIGVGRILPEDASFAGYHCPKDTILVSQNQVSSRLERFFKNAEVFEPGRWIKGHRAYHKTHPYLVLPFGHGPRSCIARRLAEQNLYILLAKLVRRFHIDWHGGELTFTSKLINRPDGPLLLTFREREIL